MISEHDISVKRFEVAVIEIISTGLTKGILFVTGISTALLFIFYIAYELLSLKGYDGFAGSIEAILYLTTLFFWISVIISLVMISRMRGRIS
ncbi:MAG: hypothetical protein OEQ53_11835 [Saprospiraceae bacterium]|nr:hypothetical protein [Saprospiraceae bacterium]